MLNIHHSNSSRLGSSREPTLKRRMVICDEYQSGRRAPEFPTKMDVGNKILTKHHAPQKTGGLSKQSKTCQEDPSQPRNVAPVQHRTDKNQAVTKQNGAKIW